MEVGRKSLQLSAHHDKSAPKPTQLAASDSFRPRALFWSVDERETKIQSLFFLKKKNSNGRKITAREKKKLE